MNTSIWNLLSNRLEGISMQKGIEIPMIQRDYAQGRENAKSLEIRQQFLHNIKEHLQSYLLGNTKKLELDFVYGYIERDCFVPLDGQQRLTTLFLLHWYFILKKDALDKYGEELNRFKYQTRPSSAQFIGKLVNNYSYKNYQESKVYQITLSESIKGKNWYFDKWKYDSTIQSILVVIDTIDEIFGDFNFPLEPLLSSSQFIISFNFLNINSLGLSDDLYVKMNARGKSLTNFENLKAELSKFIEASTFNNKHQFDFKHSEGIKQLNVENYFITKIDTTWTDYFWKLRDKKTNSFDNQLLNVLSFIALNDYAKINIAKFDKVREAFEKKQYLPSFYQFKSLGLLTENVIINFISFLDILVSEDNLLVEYLTKNKFFDKTELFKNYVFSEAFSPIYAERLRFYGITQFVKIIKQIEQKQSELEKFDRLIHNLTVTANTFNSSEDFVKGLKAIDNLLDNYNGNLHHTFLLTDVIGFDGLQVQEEKLKIALMERGNLWVESIIEMEAQPYLKGQINFLLSFAGIQDSFDFDTNTFTRSDVEDLFPIFRQLFNKYLLYFDENGVREFPSQAFRVALLSIGDYLISSKNWCFVLNNHRDASWKRYFREVFNKSENFAEVVEYLKRLFEETDLSKSATENLKKIKNLNPVSKRDWRKHFINNPELIGFRNSYYIRWFDEGHDIHLLNRSIFSNRAIELYTYLVHKKLLKIGIHSKIEFVEKYGKSGLVSIGNKKSKLFYNLDGRREFVLNQRGVEDLTFASINQVVNYLMEYYTVV